MSPEPKRRIPEDSAAYCRWLAVQIESRFGGLWLTPETAMFVGMALRGYGTLLDGHAASKLTFTVTAFDMFDKGEVIAAALNISVASASYQAALATRPRYRVMLHQGATVISEGVGHVLPDARP